MAGQAEQSLQHVEDGSTGRAEPGPKRARHAEHMEDGSTDRAEPGPKRARPAEHMEDGSTDGAELGAKRARPAEQSLEHVAVTPYSRPYLIPANKGSPAAVTPDWLLRAQLCGATRLAPYLIPANRGAPAAETPDWLIRAVSGVARTPAPGTPEATPAPGTPETTPAPGTPETRPAWLVHASNHSEVNKPVPSIRC